MQFVNCCEQISNMTSDANISQDAVQCLINTVVENSSTVENLALELIRSQHVPLLNSTLCLTNEDCRIILKCSEQCQDVTERCILLLALTDFVSCVSANSETFPLESRKNEGRRIALLMQMLHRNWRKCLANLTTEVMTSSQMSNIIHIFERCMDRMPNKGYKIHMDVILRMMNKALNVLKPVKVNDTHLCNERKKKEMKEESKKEKRKLKEIPELIPIATITSSIASKTVPVHKHDESKKESKGKKRHAYDITRYTLKSCENVMKVEGSAHVQKMLNKRKVEEIEVPASTCDGWIVKDIVVSDDEVPPFKKHCVHDDLINGKANAFKLLMKSRRAGKLVNNTSCPVKC